MAYNDAEASFKPAGGIIPAGPTTTFAAISISAGAATINPGGELFLNVSALDDLFNEVWNVPSSNDYQIELSFVSGNVAGDNLDFMSGAWFGVGEWAFFPTSANTTLRTVTIRASAVGYPTVFADVTITIDPGFVRTPTTVIIDPVGPVTRAPGSTLWPINVTIFDQNNSIIWDGDPGYPSYQWTLSGGVAGDALEPNHDWMFPYTGLIIDPDPQPRIITVTFTTQAPVLSASTTIVVDPGFVQILSSIDIVQDGPWPAISGDTLRFWIYAFDQYGFPMDEIDIDDFTWNVTGTAAGDTIRYLEWGALEVEIGLPETMRTLTVTATYTPNPLITSTSMVDVNDLQGLAILRLREPAGRLTRGQHGQLVFPIVTRNISAGTYQAAINRGFIPAGITVPGWSIDPNDPDWIVGPITIAADGTGTLTLSGNPSQLGAFYFVLWLWDGGEWIGDSSTGYVHAPSVITQPDPPTQPGIGAPSVSAPSGGRSAVRPARHPLNRPANIPTAAVDEDDTAADDDLTAPPYEPQEPIHHTQVIAEPTILRLVIGDIIFTLNGIPQPPLEAAPFIDPAYNRTMVPLRIVAEALGAQVDWIEETRTVLINQNGTTLLLSVDQPLPDGMGMAAIVNDRTFVPVAYVAGSLGANVRWDDTHWAVYIYIQQQQ